MPWHRQLESSQVIKVFPYLKESNKLNSQALSKNFPLSVENLMSELRKYFPVKELLNAVSLSCNSTATINSFGYALPKHENNADKIRQAIVIYFT